MTYVYADQTAVLGPLATYAEPHAYDLCEVHSERLSAPRGWSVVRLAHDIPTAPSNDDLVALADAVREAAQPRAPHRSESFDGPSAEAQSGVRESARRGHLRVLRDDT
ncbi:MAG: hypothetical protein NVSMB48_20470 [Marmoricola sp.]